MINEVYKVKTGSLYIGLKEQIIRPRFPRWKHGYDNEFQRGFNAGLDHAINVILDNSDNLKSIIVPIKQSLEQDIENPMIGMLPNLEEET